MSHKRKGQLTTSGEWAKHLRPFGRRLFWSSERAAERNLVKKEMVEIEAKAEQALTQKEVEPKIVPKNMQP